MKQRDKKSGRKERYTEIRRMYDAFTVKDMTFDEFKRAYERETSPRNMKRELNELVRYRSHQRTQNMVAAQSKKQIDTRLSEN